MVTQQLLDYIKQQQQLGKSNEEIRQNLTTAGWHTADIDQGLNPSASGAPIPINSELPKARQIFSESWVIYKARFKTLVIISLIPTAAYFLVLLAIGGGAAIGQINNIQSGQYGIPGIILGIIAAVLLIYLYVWGSVSTLFAIKDQTGDIGWKQAFIKSREKIGAYFLTCLLMGLAVFGGFILLIIPGILFSFWFSQSPYIVVEENLKNTAALKRSKYYVKGRIGEVFGKLFYMGIISMGLYIAFAIILGILVAIFVYAVKVDPVYISWLFNIFPIVWAPITAIYGYQLYKHVKATRP